MKIAVVGSGAREHALCFKITQSPLCSKLYSIPGNPGMAELSETVPIAMTEHASIVEFCCREQIDFVVIGPEPPLVAGLVDLLEQRGIAAFGPVAAAAALEGSKAFMKQFCLEANIPTAAYETFVDAELAKQYVARCGAPIVIKTDGLAAGKGVTVAMTEQEAYDAIDQALIHGEFGSAGQKIVVEEFLQGEEISAFALLDAHSVLALSSARDYKRAHDGDAGPNTGGMGAVSPAPAMTPEVEQRILEDIFLPTQAALRERGATYRGLLYAGVMLTAKGPRLIEFNVRFGDPECQLLMMRLESDVVELLLATRNDQLAQHQAVWRDSVAVCVVMAARGYPASPQLGSKICGIDGVAQDDQLQVFHASTALRDGALVANGGRVLCVSAIGDDNASARARAYQAVGKIDWPGGFYRSDIGA